MKTSTEALFTINGLDITFTYCVEEVKESTGLLTFNHITDALFATANTLANVGYLERKKFIFQLEKVDNGISSIKVEKSLVF